MPTKKPLDCIRVSVFGASGVGKTELIASLKCGLMRSLFRQGSALLSAVTGGDQTDRQSATNGGGGSSASRTGWYTAPQLVSTYRLSDRSSSPSRRTVIPVGKFACLWETRGWLFEALGLSYRDIVSKVIVPKELLII
jgi:hypothetical protein